MEKGERQVQLSNAQALSGAWVLIIGAVMALNIAENKRTIPAGD